MHTAGAVMLICEMHSRTALPRRTLCALGMNERCVALNMQMVNGSALVELCFSWMRQGCRYRYQTTYSRCVLPSAET